MDGFIDPRLDPSPHSGKPSPRTTPDPEELTELHRLCREGRLYGVERWIQAGRPLQLAENAPPRRRRADSALDIALEDESHALTLLLLCNGYDPNLEPSSPLDLALQARRWDLLDLLLEWGADPKEADLGALYDTYNSRLWERFRGLGVDLTAGHALASALAYHTSNKPLFGFTKRHRESDPKIQQELNIALGHHVEKGSEKGVQLCLWAGADPHAPAPGVGESEDEEERGGSRIRGFSAIWKACLRGNVEVLRRLGPDPERDDFDDLYHFARSGAVIELLAGLAPPRNVGALIQAQLWPLTIRLDGPAGRRCCRPGIRRPPVSRPGSKKQYYYGVKLHVLARHRPGTLPLPERVIVSRASEGDLPVLKLYTAQLPEGELFADKIYRDQQWQSELQEQQHLILRTPIKRKMGQESLDAADRLYSRAVSRVRQPIESFFHWLDQKTGIQNASRVRSSAGLWVHVFGRLAAALLLLALNP